MKRTKTPYAARLRRHRRLRKRIRGTSERPRLSVYRSLEHIYAQVIDDDAGRTLVAASDMESEIRGQANGKRKTDVATLVGEAIGERAKKSGVQSVVFDRGGYQFHGRIKALAEAAREAGLKF